MARPVRSMVIASTQKDTNVITRTLGSHFPNAQIVRVGSGRDLQTKLSSDSSIDIVVVNHAIDDGFGLGELRRTREKLPHALILAVVGGHKQISEAKRDGATDAGSGNDLYTHLPDILMMIDFLDIVAA